MTDESINRAIAEHIEPNPQFNPPYLAHTGTDRSDGSCWVRYVLHGSRRSPEPRNFLTDPAMLPVMLERICKKQPYRGGIELRWWPEAQQYHCVFEDERGVTMSEATGLQRAVAMSYLRAFGLE